MTTSSWPFLTFYLYFFGTDFNFYNEQHHFHRNNKRFLSENYFKIDLTATFLCLRSRRISDNEKETKHPPLTVFNMMVQ